MQIVLGLKVEFTDGVLLKMMKLAKADRPFVGRLEAKAAISPGSNVRAFDW
jgi:hypothetical protein